MRLFNSIFVIFSLAPGLAFSSSESVTGIYRQEVQGHWEEVAKVYARGGALKISFARGCTAELRAESDEWTGSCTMGRNYNTAVFEARIPKSYEGKALLFRVREYGDEELGFSGFSKALK